MIRRSRRLNDLRERTPPDQDQMRNWMSARVGDRSC